MGKGDINLLYQKMAQGKREEEEIRLQSISYHAKLHTYTHSHTSYEYTHIHISYEYTFYYFFLAFYVF